MRLSNTMIMNEKLLPNTKKAFTLAEVLITLSILGVVAALTIPSLVNRQNELAAVTRMKKAISSYESMAEIYMAENEATDLSALPTGTGNGAVDCDQVANYFKVVGKVDNNKCIFTTADGVVWSINPDTGYATILDSARGPRYGAVMWAEGGVVNGTQTDGISGDTKPVQGSLAATPVGQTISGMDSAITGPEHGFFAPANMLNMKPQQNAEAAAIQNTTPATATGISFHQD